LLRSASAQSLLVDIKRPVGIAIFTGNLVIGGGPIEDKVLDDVSGLAPQLSAKVTTREYVTIRDRRAGHVTLRDDGGTVTDVFIVPGKTVHAILSFTIPEALASDESASVNASVEATALTSPAP
jgi:hypothetical protein